MFSKSLKVPSKEAALPGRETRMPVPDVHFVNRHRLEPPFSGRTRTGNVRNGLLLGRGAEILGAAWRLYDGRRVCRRTYAESDV